MEQKPEGCFLHSRFRKSDLTHLVWLHGLSLPPPRPSPTCIPKTENSQIVQWVTLGPLQELPSTDPGCLRGGKDLECYQKAEAPACSCHILFGFCGHTLCLEIWQNGHLQQKESSWAWSWMQTLMAGKLIKKKKLPSNFSWACLLCLWTCFSSCYVSGLIAFWLWVTIRHVHLLR